MDKDHTCNPQALSFYCFQCLAGICSKCAKNIHKDHPLSAIADYKEILDTQCATLASAKNLKALYQLRQEAAAIIDSYISKCENDVHKVENAIKNSLTLGTMQKALIPKFVELCSVQSTLKETFTLITKAIFQSAANIAAKVNTSKVLEKVPTVVMASISKDVVAVKTDIQCAKINAVNTILADNGIIYSLKKEYSDRIYYYLNYRSEYGPLASFAKKLANNDNITVWNTKGILLHR